MSEEQNKIIKVRTVSQLPTVDTLGNESLLMVSNKLIREDDKKAYQTFAITGKDFNKSVYKAVTSELSIQHGLHDGMRLDDMEEQLSYIVNGHPTFELSGTHHLSDHPIYNNGPLSSYADGFNNYSVNLEDLKNFSAAGNALMINSGANFTTRYFNVENNEYQRLSGIENAPSTEADKHNVYIFKIKGYMSNTWTCPAHGMFTCYGWVDEKNGAAKNNAKRWIALEGQFDDPNDNTKKIWKILQLQPVIPNEFCSYVSFNFPVNQGMVLRLESGFNVGTNSDKYSQIQGSLTNHLANAFVGGVYSKFRWDFGTYSDTSGSDIYVDGAEIKEVPNHPNTIQLKLNRSGLPDDPVWSNKFTLPDGLSNLTAQKANDNSGIIIKANDNNDLTAKISSSDLLAVLSNDILGMFPKSIVQTITGNTLTIGEQDGNPVLSSNIAFTVASRSTSEQYVPTAFNIETQSQSGTMAGSSCSHRSWSGPNTTLDSRTIKSSEDKEYFQTVSELNNELKDEENVMRMQSQSKKPRRTRKKA